MGEENVQMVFFSCRDSIRRVNHQKSNTSKDKVIRPSSHQRNNCQTRMKAKITHTQRLSPKYNSVINKLSGLRMNSHVIIYVVAVTRQDLIY